MDSVYGVIFKDGTKTYFFKGKDSFKNGDYVIVDTEKGLQYAKIVQDLGKKEVDGDLKSIIRLANEEDKENYLKNLKDADQALKKCIKFAQELDLKMKVINAQFTLERTQLLFNFCVDEVEAYRKIRRMASWHGLLP